MKYENPQFDAKFTAATERAGQAADQGFTALTKTLQEAIAMQSAEITRLRGIIADGTVIPQRHLVSASLATAQDGTRTRRDAIALASDKSAWVLLDLPSHPSGMRHHQGWCRLPAIPQAADELNAPTPGRAVE